MRRPLTLILCRLSTAGGFSSDSIPPRGTETGVGRGQRPRGGRTDADVTRGAPFGAAPFCKLRVDGADTAPQMLNLQNEANFPGCCALWISLRDKMLKVQVCHFVTWLRLGVRRGIRDPK